jgi:hypothetical protein
MRLIAGGELLYTQKGDFASLQSPVSIGTAWESRVDVASWVVEPFDAPLPAAPRACRVREPIRGNTVLLQGLGPNRHWCGIGCKIAALKYFGAHMSDAWVFGGTGRAFVLNIHVGLCPSGPTAWNAGDGWGHLTMNVGCSGTHHVAWAKEYEEGRPRLWEAARKAIDAGYPASSWDIGGLAEDLMICGYDDHGNYLYLDHNGTIRKHPYQRLGRIQMGFTNMHIYEFCEPASDRTTVRDALAFALETATGKHRENPEKQRAGLAGYEAWVAALGDPEIWRSAGDGCAYNAACWSECRTMAVGFLREARERLSDAELDDLFGQAIAHYGEVSDAMREVAWLFPNDSHAAMDARIQESDRRSRAVKALTAARDAEAKGLEVLEELVAAV